MKKLLFNSFLFLIFLGLSFPISGKNIDNLRIESNGTNYKINFTLSDFNLNQVSIKGETFLKLEAPGFGVNPEAGIPALPLLSFNMVIPYDQKDVSVRVNSVSTSEQALSAKIYPKQDVWEKNRPISERPFTINRDYYTTGGSIEAPVVKVGEPYIIHGVKGVTVTIYPFSYNPSTNQLVYVTEGQFEVELGSYAQYDDITSVYNEFYKETFVNYQPVSVKNTMDYLIICPDEYMTQMEEFANYKTSKGYVINQMSTSQAGTSTSSIKSTIQNLYNNTATRPEFILLVGDVNDIPNWTGTGYGTPATDLNYVQLEGGDYYADAFIGRFSITNSGELANIIMKSMYMDNYIGTLEKNNVWMASTDNYSITEGTHNYCINNYFDPEGYDNLKLYTVTHNATTQQLIDALNANKQFAVFSGHGAVTYWADGPELTASQVEALTNTYYSYVYSFACVTGQYTSAECFGETWIRAEHGASIFYGSSVNSYWDEDNILESELFEAMFEDDLTKVTPMMDQGKLELCAYYGGNVTSGSDLLRYLEMYNLMGDPSMATTLQLIPDETPPEAITDLATGASTSNLITLNWTAPYDSTLGGVIGYDIRHSTSPILNEDDFNNAAQSYYGGNSDSAGTAKTFTVTGLEPETMYYFAVKALDIWSNASPMSNATDGTTLDAPVISTNPDEINKSLSAGVTVIDSVVISNVSSGASTLNYEVELANHTYPGDVKMKLVPLASAATEKAELKDKPEEIKGQSFKGFGGPDAFGYEWIDSDEPNGPEYVWEDISTTGTELTNWTPTGTYGPKDEGYAGPIDFGFDFKYYGEARTEAYVSSNGIITFNVIGSNCFSNYEIPDTDDPNNFIAPFWDDLDGKDDGKVYYKTEANRVIIQYQNWHKYSGDGDVTMQVVLHKSGKILIYYENMTIDVESSTVGIENVDGTIGLQVAYSAPYVTSGLALQIAAEPDWLGASNLSGMLYNGNSAAVMLEFTTDDLEPGIYSMDMVITSNDPVNSEVTVPITMNIGGVVTGWTCDIMMSDANSESSQDLKIGLDPMGTDDIDSDLGEIELPPAPPAGVFDARFIIPGNLASLIDIRNIELTEVQWELKFQADGNNYPLTLTWDPAELPDGMFMLKDPFGGSLVNVNMKTQNTVDITNTALTSLFIEYSEMMGVNMNVNLGWNMISVPVHAEDMTVSGMFPEMSTPVYMFNNGYSQVTEFGMGQGYWAKFGEAGPHMIMGMPETTPVAVNAGWNMVGPYESEIAVADIISNPAGIITSAFYGFGTGYSTASALMPGKGYWVKVSEAGELMYSGATAKRNPVVNEINSEWSKIIITDATGASRTLYISSEKAAGFELPPAPPEGIFDVRYSTGSMVEAMGMNTVMMNSAQYPVKVRVEGADVKISDNIGGSILSATLKDGNETVITNSSVTSFVVEGTEIPEVFALEQNYPNPFNPATKIRFSLPVNAKVTLTIFNALGQKVSTLANTDMEAGIHTVNFDASSIASGIYFYTISAEGIDGSNFSNTKKMILMK